MTLKRDVLFALGEQSCDTSKQYLDKYWLDDETYSVNYKWIKDKFFIENAHIPNMVFKQHLKLNIIETGVAIDQEDFSRLQRCMEHVGDKYFFMIENENLFHKAELLKFKYPFKIKYEELNPYSKSGKYEGITYDTFVISIRQYFIFGDSGKWAAYSASDYNSYPFFAICCDKEYQSFFDKEYFPNNEDIEIINNGVPPEYKENTDYAVPVTEEYSQVGFDLALKELTSKSNAKRKDGLYLFNDASFIKIGQTSGYRIIEIHDPKTGIRRIHFKNS